MEQKLKVKNRFSQSQYLVFGFISIILLGAVLLMTPFASRSGETTEFLDCMFTSLSATCVTGLVVVDTFTHWNVFGQIIILTLIQIGGLGFITIGVSFSLLLRNRIGLKTRGLMQESINSVQIGGMVKLTKKIIIGTAIIEGAGALILGIRFAFDFGFFKGMYYGVFHSVSAFCNGGFDLMGVRGAYSSLSSYVADPLVNIVVCILIIVGGIGFVVWDDISINKLNFKKYSLHTKVVLITSFILVFCGAGIYYILEKNNTMANMNAGEKILASLFSACTARTAGFNTIDTGALTSASKIFTMALMFIGGSPGSTAGGIKTTTIFILVVLLWSEITNRRKTSIFKRRFGDEALKKAGTVFFLNLFLAVIACITILAVTSLPMDDILFEVFSAIGTVGMSTGITRELNSVARIIIMILMFCGRVGSLSFALSFLKKKKDPPVYYPKEEISVG